MSRRVVLVTGATGLIGTRTIAPLRALGFEVHGLSRRPSVVEGMAHISADLRDPAQAAAVLTALRPSHILHCAWDVTHGVFWESPENIAWVAATLNLAHAAAVHGVGHFIGVGTGVEYDWSINHGVARREGDATGPASLYGIAKDHTRALLFALGARSGMRVAWGRVFDLFGVGENQGRLVAALVRTLRAGETFTCRHGQLERDYMAAEDVGVALAHVVASGVSGPVNIAAGRSITIGELARMAAARLGAEAQLVVERRPAPGQPAVMRVDVSRLRDEVGAPVPGPLAGHFARMIPR